MRSWWLAEAGAGRGAGEDPSRARRPMLDGDHRADVCIVGGGFTGLWTALRIKEQAPATEVVARRGGHLRRRRRAVATAASRCRFWHHFQGLERGVRQRRGAAARARLVRRDRPTSARFCDAARHRRPLPPRRLAVDGDQPGAARGVGQHDRGDRAPRRGSRSSPSTRTSWRAAPARPRTSPACSRPTSATVQPALLARGLAARRPRARRDGVRGLADGRARALDAAGRAHRPRAASPPTAWCWR